jgi:hypothetical protein
VARLTVRITDRLERRLDALARERGRTRAALVREMLEAGVQGVAAPPSERPTEEELLELLSEKARQGNVAGSGAFWPASRSRTRVSGRCWRSSRSRRSVGSERLDRQGVRGVGPGAVVA